MKVLEKLDIKTNFKTWKKCCYPTKSLVSHGASATK